MAVSQTDLLIRLKDKLLGYKEYLVSLHLGSNRSPVKKIKDSKDTRTTVEDEEDESKSTEESALQTTAITYQSTVKQLDVFSKKLEARANSLNFEELKAARAMTQDLAEYITKETYALTNAIAYPTARYYGYNTAGAAASGKGGFADPTSPESALKSEIKSLKGMLINWRNFPVAKDMGAPPPGAGGANGVSALPNLVREV